MFKGHCLLICLASYLAACCFTTNVAAFELTPSPTRAERELAKRTSGIRFRLFFPLIDFATHTFTSSVHEGLAQLAYQCPLGGLDDCADADLDVANVGIIVGVRWNDDPPFQFLPGQGKYSRCPPDTKPPATISFALRVECWVQHFRDVSQRAEMEPTTYTSGNGTLLARTHFGDLQFLHGMADSPNVPPAVTQQKIMMWSEFMWRTQSGASDRIARTTRMGQVPVAGLSAHFPPQEERSVQDLFTVGRPWMRLHMGDITFGSFLHMVQDSFAGGHVTRRARAVTDSECAVPEIVEFHTYAGQDKDAHKLRDSMDAAKQKIAALLGISTLADVLTELVRRREDGQSWTEVRPYLEQCVFRLAADARLSSTGVEP